MLLEMTSPKSGFMMSFDEQRSWLEDFIVNNPDLEQLEALLAEFNIFEAIGVVQQELRHSDFLAFLLNPAENHGLGDIFLKKFLMRLLIEAQDPPLSAIEIDVVNLQGAEVQREWRNIDILIQDPVNRLVCAIENKVDTTEHSDQLRRYREIVGREFAGQRSIFIYLTPEGDEPSDENYLSFSYAQMAELIDTVCQAYKSTLKPDVFTLMTHYPKMLRRHIVSDSEIAQLCHKIYQKHKKAIELIYAHRPGIGDIIDDKLKELVNSTKVREELIAAESDFIKRYSYFADKQWDTLLAQLQNQGWVVHKRPLYFEFVNNPDELSLRLCIRSKQLLPVPIRETIYHFARSRPATFRASSNRISKNPIIYRRQFLSPKDYGFSDVEVLIEKVQSEWNKFLNQDLPAIRQAFTEIQWPNPVLNNVEH